jgi:chromosome segregation ATPase
MELEREKGKRISTEKELEETKQYVPYKKESEELRRKVAELEPLLGFKEYKKKYEELEALYQKEQERLAKLYKIYEDTTTELKQAKETLKKWETWFSDNRAYVEKAADAFSKFKQPEI